MESKADKSGKIAPEHAAVPATNPNEEMGYIDRVETAKEYNEHQKERLERDYSMEIIKWDEMFNDAPELATWLKKLVRYGNVDSQVLIMRKYHEESENKEDWTHIRCWLYTEEHRYTFSAHIYQNRDSYLGGYVQNRKPRPGESWTRGNDLPDGKYSEKTFNSIVRSILAYELKSIQIWRKE